MSDGETRISDDNRILEDIRSHGYDDQIVQLKVGDQVHEISSRRLMLRSAIFKQMFSVPPESIARQDEPIDCAELDPEAFADYVWYIHADPIDAQEFFATPPSLQKCNRLLGIAIVMHLFQADKISAWAAKEAVDMLCQTTRAFQVDIRTAKLLLELAMHLQEPHHSELASSCRDIVCDALHPDRAGPLSVDPISALGITREDRYVLAHVYFYILRMGRGYDWKGDERLLPVDRRRLLCAAYTLDSPARVHFQTPWEGCGEQHSAARYTGAKTYRYSPPLGAGTRAINVTPRSIAVSQVDSNGAAEWKPLIHHDISSRRNDLWAHFDDESWRLSD